MLRTIVLTSHGGGFFFFLRSLTIDAIMPKGLSKGSIGSNGRVLVGLKGSGGMKPMSCKLAAVPEKCFANRS